MKSDINIFRKRPVLTILLCWVVASGFQTAQAQHVLQVATKAIEKTVEFFHKMGMKTKISENAENIEKTADFIVNRFEERGWKAMGEKQNITLEKVRAIVEMSY